MELTRKCLLWLFSATISSLHSLLLLFYREICTTMPKKILIALALAASALGVQAADTSKTLTIATSPVPHGEILAFIKPTLQAQGLELQIKEFSDYVQPNVAVQDGQLDVSYFQSLPYMHSYNKARGSNLVAVPNGEIHVEPFGAYSKKIKNIKDLADKATIAIPSEPSNTGRALILLAKHGVIELKNPTDLNNTPLDITSNPKKLTFKELEAPLLPRVLNDVDLALINTNYALEAGLNPGKDALLIENADSPYLNVVAARADRADDPRIAQLVKALRTPEVKQFIQDKYQGAVVPAF